MSTKIVIEVELCEATVLPSEIEAVRVHLSNIVSQAAGLLGITSTPSTSCTRITSDELPKD